MSKAIKLNIDNNGVANLVFDLAGEKVNKLSAPVLLELEQIINELRENQKVKILIIKSSKENIFIAGADIGEIKQITTEEEAKEKVTIGQNIFNKISALPFPTLAVIDGACLGGGLELALACNYRICSDGEKVKIGLPEVSLGIIPGFGGTQRLPLLIGLEESLKIILSAKPVDARKAFKIGVVDQIIRQEFLSDGIEKFIAPILKDSKPNEITERRKKIAKKRFISEILLGKKYLIYFLAKKDLLKKTKGHYPAPLAALEVVKKTYHIKDLAKGLKIEVREFAKLAISPICKNLINLFFISEEIKKETGAAQNISAVQKVGLLGAGVMGGGIAFAFSNADIETRMKDISQKAVALGFDQVLKIYQQLKKIRKIDDNKISVKMNKISSSLDYSGFDDVDLVVEAIIEDMNIKKQSLSELENYVGAAAIIASNTSSLSITEMAKALKNPQRFVGMHFFNPVDRMPLVEVIRGENSSEAAVGAVVACAKKLGKTPIVVKDVAGFLVNRILIPYINEAGFLLEEGGDLQIIDQAIEDFGMPMGPFSLADTVGIDVGYKVAKILQQAYGERMRVCEILGKIAADKNLLGKKSGQGFFTYNLRGDKLAINPAIIAMSSEIILNKKIANEIGDKIDKKIDNKNKINLPNSYIIDRCILIMVNEASKCLAEGVVKNAAQLDMAMIMGTGFPPFRGGLLRYADFIGIKNIVARLEEFSVGVDGERFAPSELLVSMFDNNQNFYH